MAFIDIKFAVLPVYLLLALGGLGWSPTAGAETLITYLSGDNPNDPRNNYEGDLLRLALEKTRAEYGDYRLVPAPLGMNYMRARQAMEDNRYPNFIRNFSYRNDWANDELYRVIHFPVDLGALSYRVCFVAQNKKAEVARARTLDDLRAFSHGQGAGWLDTTILRAHGFDVVASNSYSGLFKMVSVNRIDLFCRGVSELYDEYRQYKDLPNFAIEETMAFYYPLPLYFHSHRDNIAALRRVEKGLFAAYADGSLMALWQKYYADSIRATNLPKRRIYRLHNPTLDGLPNTYEQYFFKPETVELLEH